MAVFGRDLVAFAGLHYDGEGKGVHLRSGVPAGHAVESLLVEGVGAWVADVEARYGGFEGCARRGGFG